MNTREAIAALKPFISQVPGEALEWIRGHWSEVEPVLLKEIDERLKTPIATERNALFLYAIYLCAEMKCQDAFPRYLKLCRLPNVVLDYVLGDILTEHMPEMLARTCAGRTGELQVLAEDAAVNEYARGTAIVALQNLMLEGEISREWLSSYCLVLMRDKLLRRPSSIWDSVIGVAVDIHADGMLPLIEKAFERGLIFPGFDRLERIQKEFAKPLDVVLMSTRQHRRPLDNTEHAMKFIVKQWRENGATDNKKPPENLLAVLKEHRQRPSVASIWAAGRNDPCPCGSGRKFKKCCMGQPAVETVEPISVLGRPVQEKCKSANDWMMAGIHFNEMMTFEKKKVFECWKHAWCELCALFPSTLQDPYETEETGAFAGEEFFSNWLQDFETLLVGLSEQRQEVLEYALQFFREVLERFPAMSDNIRQNMKADQARCLALSGEHDAARAVVRELMAEFPEKALGHILWAEMCSLDASKFNLKLDVPEAIRHLEQALEDANDCEDYSVALRLEEVKEWRKLLEEPL